MKITHLNATTSITPAGMIVHAVQIVLLVVGVAVYQIAPESELGSYLHQPYGIPVAIVGIVALSAVGGAVLGALGYPIVNMRRKDGG